MEDGVTPGDCFRTVIGCLTGYPPETVPHFVQLSGWNNGEECDRLAREWLKSKGFGYFQMAFDSKLENLQRAMKALNPGVFYMLAGNSANGTGHCVIGFEDTIYHDTALDNSGIVGPADDGYYWVSIIVAGVTTQ